MTPATALPHRSIRRLRAALQGGLALGAIAAMACGAGAPPCEDAFRREHWPAAVQQCKAAYGKEHREDDGLRLAQAYMYMGDHRPAAELARALASGRHAAMAHRVLGVAAHQRGEFAAAAVHQLTALAMQGAVGADREVARDAYALLMTFEVAGAYDAALELLPVARDAAIRIGDRKMQGYCELSHAFVLRSLGDGRGSERALDIAASLLAPYCDRYWVRSEMALHHVSQGHSTLARQAFDEILAAPPACQRPDLVATAHAHLAWMALRDRDIATSEHHLASLVPDDVEVVFVRALLDVARGDANAAVERLASAEGRTSPNIQFAWLVPHVRAQVEELRGDLRAAEAAYRRAIAAVAGVRIASATHAAYIVASHRTPYEGLFGLLARSGRWREALALVLALDASDLLRVTAAPGAMGHGGVVAPAETSTRPAITPRPSNVEGPLDIDSALAAWRGRDLVVVVAPSVRAIGVPDRVWRLRVVDGEVIGADVGAAADADALAERLLGNPRDREAALALGRMIVPPVDGTAPLMVLPVGRIARAPLAALRDADGLVIAKRPLVRVLGLRPRTGVPARSRRGAVVLGDPRIDLHAAADEARWVGEHLEVPPSIGRDATMARVLEARDAAVLHLAAHTNEEAARRVVHLADGDLSPEGIAASRLAPRLVVLASCGSAAARDEGGWGSHAAAFIAAGSDEVVATHWSVADVAAAELVRRFYTAGGAHDPAHALAAAQAAMADAPGNDWAAFALIAAPPPAGPLPAR